MRYIDLRSDTVTMPTEEMRKAMAEAEVGDDVYEDDPTVNRLQELAAEMVGKEAALFVPSGTFGNQLCVLTHTRRGDEVILGEDCHIVLHEVGGAAVIAGVQLRTLKSNNGMLDPADVEAAIRPGDDIHYPHTGLICVENAHGLGTAIPVNNLQAIKKIGEEHGIPVHMDGARIFNAAVALGVDAKEIAACADSVQFCLSKGLAAPVGSLVAGTKEFIEIARKNRKLMGGGMRQAGILAAAGIIALEKMTKRLHIDHENAAYLADQLSRIPGVNVKADRLDINMVFFEMEPEVIPEQKLIDHFLKNGIKICGIEDGEWRFVTNVDVTREDIDFVLAKFRECL
ncbi:MAG: low-specificity L-threonine aldolase [Clostridiales bacterium]|nr:low-specificity L-threonine aldolase [Clostridiales bacterium]